METENKFICMLQQANALYIQAEDMEKSGDYEMAKSFYQQTSAIFDEMKSSTDIFKQDDSAKSMELIATSCKRKIRILELKQTLIPKTKESPSTQSKDETKQEVDLNQSVVARKLNDIAEEDHSKDSKILNTSIAKLKSRTDKVFEKYQENLLDSFSRFENSFKNEIKKKIVEDDSNPFNDNPGNVALVEENLYKVKKVIQQLEKLKGYVIRLYQKELSSVPTTVLKSSTIEDTTLPIQESRIDKANAQEKFDRLKIRYDKLMTKISERSDKVRALEYQLDKAA